MNWIRCGTLLVGMCVLVGCRKSNQESKAQGPPQGVPVAVALAVKSDAPKVLRAIGRVESASRITIRPQVSARVLELAAAEGTDVKAGQAIVRLDARPFEVALREAQANLDQARAASEDAHNLVSRLTEVQAASAVSARDIEAARSKALASDADVQSNQARVEGARLDLEYCSIVAPFSGRLGEFSIKPGSIVKANETDLVELVQFDPIEVVCSVPEERIRELRESLAHNGDIEVWVVPSGEHESSVTGRLSFIDSAVDPATGSIRLKASFSNSARELWPGRFVGVSILLGVDKGSILIPESAVLQSQAGSIVYIVKSDLTVESRQVVVARTENSMSMIASGVNAGETVVTDGQLRLAPGSPVKIKDTPANSTVPTTEGAP